MILIDNSVPGKWTMGSAIWWRKLPSLCCGSCFNHYQWTHGYIGYSSIWCSKGSKSCVRYHVHVKAFISFEGGWWKWTGSKNLYIVIFYCIFFPEQRFYSQLSSNKINVLLLYCTLILLVIIWSQMTCFLSVIIFWSKESFGNKFCVWSWWASCLFKTVRLVGYVNHETWQAVEKGEYSWCQRNDVKHKIYISLPFPSSWNLM